MSLSAARRNQIERYVLGTTSLVTRTAADAALAELDRLQATAARRGELLARALECLDPGASSTLRAAIVAELADGEDGRG